jgi:hypothetical protein
MMTDHISGERGKHRQRSLGWLCGEVIAGLHGLAYWDNTHHNQKVKGGYQPFFPRGGQVCQSLAFQVCQPMAHTGWKQARTEPATRCYTESKQGADGFFAAADSSEMGIWAGGHNTTTQGTAVALHVQTENEAIKKARDKAMAPNFVMVAF